MRFDPPLVSGTFVRRYKRFFIDAQLPDGETVVAHCPNTGSLRGCLQEGGEVLLARSTDPTRKLQWSWKMIHVGSSWVGVDTGVAPVLVAEALNGGLVPELAGFERHIAEVRYGADGRSRIDLLLARGGTAPAGLKPAARARALWDGEQRVYVEIKNTTLRLDGATNAAAFPDAVTERGQKHLEELMHVVDSGHRAAMVFCVQRSDCTAFTAADTIDPTYGKLLRQAIAHGVEAYALAASLESTEIKLTRRLPIQL